MIKESDFELTEETKNLTIKGALKLFAVVKIPLEKLKYNRQNGRIATWISEYENEILPEETEKFNEVVEGFIKNSNPESLKKTKANIERFGQMEPAVVLENGILVDGNRRFTALRQLKREGKGAEFNYIKAVILSDSYSTKEIKTLELNLQHAKEERVDYNPIDRLVDIYRDLLSPGAEFSPAEYAREVDEKESKVRDNMSVAQLMIDYLDYIQHPNMFYIARQQKLDGPLREISKILKSKKIDPYDYNDAKDILFASLATVKGDATRKIRDMRSVIENPRQLHSVSNKLDQTMDDLEEYFSDDSARSKEQFEISEKDSEKTQNNTDRYTVQVPQDIVDRVNETVETEIDNSKLKKAEKAPLKALSKCVNYLHEADPQALGYISEKSEKDKDDIFSLLNELKKGIKEIEDEL
ncbi:ParB/RepB/Spo0J family partition protein [Ligilactobacillus pobuzihii]|uniref:ParB-like N-terminal domain-containing protein n=1 Tax=Ligilactobacillus pobuzihii TaxID=449659 RepID=A0A0R2LAX8_9LACO|nr:ParB/RepB/Spo0J family partition protein [Ligilactobacillus pobuzihii]KRK09975.1 hypothetical protein FD11_GL000385 [Ligilactobacillus pobuzihii E100301 = KCTC 13174]KRN95604.1 hypothetical protein IV66_GL001051 [Ligilactobacillus pobuzihii]GEN47978.1 hypothetical protein LPO01_07700 [Ligilactobacillus pobuzihii]